MNRVVVTGMGTVSPTGIGIDRAWDSAVRGESASDEITRFDASEFPVEIACEVPDFDDSLSKRERKRTANFVRYAIEAGDRAVEDAGIDLDEPRYDAGVSVSSGVGGQEVFESAHDDLSRRGPRRVSPYYVPSSIPNMAAGRLSIRHDLRGPNLTYATACAAGGHAIIGAYDSIRQGRADVMLAGGAESTITPLFIAGFHAMRALSTRNDEPERASRPFDAQRDGFVMGEGSAIMALESLEHARERGAEPYAEVLGVGMTSDASHVTAPLETGESSARCMERALDDAGVAPDAIDYVNAHATSTPKGDEAEARAIERVFGRDGPPVSSTKGVTGHTFGTSGSLEACFCVESIREDRVPPTANLDDPIGNLDHVTESREYDVSHAVTNSFGFGGTNASLVFGDL